MSKRGARLTGLAPVLAAAASAANAGVSITPALVSDYDFRGYSQSDREPALQIGIDYDRKHMHVGAWASSVDLGPGDARAELDLFADYTFGSDRTVEVNTGLLFYTYPGHADYTFPEVWITASKGWCSVSYRYSWDWARTSREASYLEASVTVPVAAAGLSVVGHVGHSTGQYWNRLGADHGRTGAYTDYSLGVSRRFGEFTAAAKYVDSTGVDVNDLTPLAGNVLSNAGRVIVSVSTTLPWARR